MIRSRDIFKIAAFAVLLGPMAHAQENCGARFGVERPFLYTITRDQKTSHLIGTVPMGVSLKDLPIEVHQILDRATDLTLELRNRHSPLDWVDNKLLSVLMLNRSGPRISTLLTRAQWDTYLTRVMQSGFPVKIADRLTVGTAAILMNPYMKDREQREERGRLSRELEARFKGKSVRSLHPSFYRVRNLTAYSDIGYLRAQLDRDPDARVRAYESAYRTADEAAVLDLLEDERRLAPKVVEATIDARNRDWAPLLAKRHRTKGHHVFAIGAVHLVGPGGVIERLRSVGFTVERSHAPLAEHVDGVPDPSVVFESDHQ